MQATSPKPVASVNRSLNVNPAHEHTHEALCVLTYLRAHGATAWVRGDVAYAIERGTISFGGCTPEPYACIVRFETFYDAKVWLGY